MQEYPKALYLAGAMAMAADEAQEVDLREAGHAEWHVDQKRMKRDDSAAEAGAELAKPDTSALDEAKEELQKLEALLVEKDRDLAMKEQELAMRDARLAEAEADLAARLDAIGSDAANAEDGPVTPPEQPADDKQTAKTRKKAEAAQ